MTEKHPSLAAALIAAQQQFTPVKKDNTANTGKFSYTYADLGSVLEAVTPALHAHGLVISQLLDSIGTQPAIRTVLMHADSGEQIGGTFPVSCADFNDPQKVGGGVTYARRYALMALLNLNAEDDDANHARQPQGKKFDFSQVERPRSANGNGNVSRNTPQTFTRATESDVSSSQDSGHQAPAQWVPDASDRAVTEAPRERTNPNGPSPAQIRRFHAMRSQLGLSEDDASAELDNAYGVESAEELDWRQYKDFTAKWDERIKSKSGAR